MLSDKFKDENFRFKFWLIVILFLFVISYFFNFFTNKEPLYEYPYMVSYMYFLPIIIFSVDYIKNDRKLFPSFLVGFLIVTLLWLSIIGFVFLVSLVIEFFPFEFKKMTLTNILLTWFFITMPLFLFFSMGVLIWLLSPIYHLSDCFKKKEKFNLSELFKRKVLGDFAVNPFKLLFFYFTIPWRIIRLLLRKFLSLD